jgi:hypothetical protein
MTSPTPPSSDLDTIVSRTRHLLMDFDGPICSIFAGLPAATVADRLRKLFADHAQLPDAIARTRDPSRYSPTPPPSATSWPPASRPR